MDARLRGHDKFGYKYLGKGFSAEGCQRIKIHQHLAVD